MPSVVSSSNTCTLCNNGAHLKHQCPLLIDPLKEGFYSGKHEEGGDEDGE